MVDVKTAVQAAAKFAEEMLNAPDVLLEEIELIDAGEDNPVWHITLSLPKRYSPESLGAGVATAGMAKLFGTDREYKTFAVNAHSGRIESMKIRELANR